MPQSNNPEIVSNPCVKTVCLHFGPQFGVFLLVFNYLLTSKSFLSANVTLVLRVNTSPRGTVAEGEDRFLFSVGYVSQDDVISASVLHTSIEN